MLFVQFAGVLQQDKESIDPKQRKGDQTSGGVDEIRNSGHGRD